VKVGDMVKCKYGQQEGSMTYPENNRKNRYELAENFISDWDEQELYKFVVNSYVQDYELHPSVFEDDWDEFKDSHDWSKKMLEDTKKGCPNHHPDCCCGMCEKQDDEN